MRRIVFVTALALGTLNEARADDRLQPFASCATWDEALADPIVDHLMALSGYEYGAYGWAWYGGYWPDLIMDRPSVAAEARSSEAASAPGPGSFTGTNVQEQGVDELDFVKTDGKFIYLLNGPELAIVRSWPASEAAKVGAVAIEGTPSSLFLHGDRAIVTSTITPTWAADRSYDPYGYSQYGAYGLGATRLTVVDVSDRARPTVIRSIDVEGTLVSGRMVDGEVYMVLNATAPVPPEVWSIASDGQIVMPTLDPRAPADVQEATRRDQRAIFRARVRAVLARDNSEGLLRFADTHAGAAPTEGRLLDCAGVYRGEHSTGLGMLALVHLDLDDDRAEPDAAGLLGQGWTVYASQDHLYTALTTGAWWGWGRATGQPEPGTEIHKFRLRGKHGGPEYVASGNVDGWLATQFAMSEHEGRLRVASTRDDWWWGSGAAGTGSQVSVLADDGEGRLFVEGEVDGIAPGEQMYGVRFVGDKGYLVTFRQVDPLHVLDLSDPKNPRVTGELHIPGYSSYLHPMDDDHLLAVGMDGTESGTITGMKISIFDVSDPTHPRESHKYTIGGDGWAGSEALTNHHAFTWADGVLTIPAYSTSYHARPDGSYEYDYWGGAIVMRADAEYGIWELGRVDHDDLARDLCQTAATAEQCDQAHAQYGYYYGWSYGTWATMRRSIYIDDTLVTVSNLGVKFTRLRHPRVEYASVLLPEGQFGYYAY